MLRKTLLLAASHGLFLTAASAQPNYVSSVKLNSIADSTPGAILQPQPPPCDSEVRRGVRVEAVGAAVMAMRSWEWARAWIIPDSCGRGRGRSV